MFKPVYRPACSAILMLGMVAFAGQVQAQCPPPSVILVDHEAPDGGNGLLWETAFNNLSAALTFASDPLNNVSEIWVAEGTYLPDTTDLPDPRAATFRLIQGVEMYGGFAGDETHRHQRRYDLHPTILSGDIGVQGMQADNVRHVVSGDDIDSTTVLDGFTVRDGFASGSSFSAEGPGIFLGRNGPASPTIRNCIIRDNYAQANGAGVFCRLDSDATIVNTQIISNFAGVGGTGAGGGLIALSSEVTLDHCTIAGNDADAGGGIFISAGNVHGTNLIVYGNTATGSPGINLLGADINYSLIQDVAYPGTGNISANPNFVSAATRNYHLALNSPARNAGDPDYVAAAGAEFDTDREPRVLEGRTDMGADEVADCNGNAIADQLDLASAGDCNHNGVPDACDISSGTSNDCHIKGQTGAGRPDECDIADGLSADINANGRPDECVTEGHVVIHVPADHANIQDAIDEAPDGANEVVEIIVADGSYPRFEIEGKAVTVRSANGPDNCIIDAANQGPAVRLWLTGVGTRIEGLSLINGTTGGSSVGGAGVQGSGPNNQGASATIANCIVRNNQGQGIWFLSLDSPSFPCPECLVPARIINTVVRDNTGTGVGTSSLGRGGLVVKNCTIVNNSGAVSAGGIAAGGELLVHNSIVYDNTVTGTPLGNGQIAVFDTAATPIDAIIQYSDVEGGQAGVGLAAGAALCFGAGNLDVDPALVSSFHLPVGSPLIDTGSNALAMGARDIDREMRIQDADAVPGAVVDIGADEFASDEDCNAAGGPDQTEFANCPDNNPDCQDCNANSTLDECDIAQGGSIDQLPPGGDGIPDDCQDDCNGNGVPDNLDISSCAPGDLTCQDCNNNAVLDPCDIAGGILDVLPPGGDDIPDGCQSDCNNNDIPDNCDIDCGPPGGPCDMLGCGTADDCNGNAVPDLCDIDPADTDGNAAVSPDCDRNFIPDECDLAACAPDDPTCQDCNVNLVPDFCDTLTPFSVMSPNLTPIGNGSPQSHNFTNLPESALDQVLVTIRARADISSPSENLTVTLNGVSLGLVFNDARVDCSAIPEAANILIPSETWNASVAAAGGMAAFNITAASGVVANQCDDPESFVSIQVQYSFVTFDCNENGVPDDCDISTGFSRDVDDDGHPDDCETLITTYVDVNNPACSAPTAAGTPENPYCNIRDAALAVPPGAGNDETLYDVIVNDGTYTGVNNRLIGLTGRRMTLRSANGPANCIIDLTGATGNTRALDIGGGSRAIGFTIQNGLNNNMNSAAGVVMFGGELINCILRKNHNSGGGGGAIAVFQPPGNAVIRNCMLVDNSSSSNGGAAHLLASATFINCTFANNTANTGGAIFTPNSTPVTLNVINSIMHGNVASSGAVTHNIRVAVGAKANISHSDIQGGQGSISGGGTVNYGPGNIEEDPLFVDAVNANPLLRNYHLSCNGLVSPCVDAGNNDVVVPGEPDPFLRPGAADVDGDDRIYDNMTADPDVVDMGADETPCIGDAADPCEGDVVAPVIVHAAGLPGQTRPYSGYIDPRWDAMTASIPAPLDRVTLVFSEPVFHTDGSPVTAANFIVTETGAGAPPTVSSVIPGGDGVTFTVVLSRPITLQQWTTVRANVADALGCNVITNMGNLGAVNEPDRVDLGFLPSDVDQNRTAQPLDLLRFRQFLSGNCPQCPHVTIGGLDTDFFDIDRSSTIQAIDLLRYRQLVFGTGGALMVWNGKTLPVRP